MEIQKVAEKALELSKKAGADKTLTSVSLNEMREYNIEGGKMTLLRTTFDQSVNLKNLKDQKISAIHGNQFSNQALENLAQNSLAAAAGSTPDEANGFAPSQGKKHFSFGLGESNEDWIFSKLSELQQNAKEKFPKIVLDSAIIKFVKQSSVMLSSDGTHFSSEQNYHDGFAMFTAKDGKKASSFNYASFRWPTNISQTNTSILQSAHLEDLFRQSSEQIETKKVPQKFDGEIILTPHCTEQFLGSWNSYLDSARMLKKSSFFLDKKDQLVASKLFSVTSNPADSDFATRKFWTSDGYLAQNEVLFEKGVLKNYLLNHYAATKLGQNVSRSEASYLKMTSGDQKLKDMIAKVKKGILMGRFSAGMPSENGDISGVAKNSYYIENGEIQYALGETMVALNLAKALHDIQSVSQESVNVGYWQLPWVQISGASVS